MRSIQYVIIGGLSIACGLMAQSQPSIAIPPTKNNIEVKLRKPTARDATANLPSLSAFDGFTNLVVQPGQLSVLTSIIDWTGADHISVAIECPSSTSLTNSAIVIQWGLPAVAPNYVT